MFSAITPRYDFLNHFLSFGRDRAWRRRAVQVTSPPADGQVLDLCCGTGDLAFEFLQNDAFHGSVTGADFCADMLGVATRKAVSRDPQRRTNWVEAEAEHLPFPNERFDVVTIAFGLRNMAEPSETLREMLRVTRAGGRCVVLELNNPPGPLWSRLFQFYFSRLSPWLGRLISGDRDAYSYLPRSVARFPSAAALATMIEQSGWGHCRFEALTGGVAYLHTAEAPPRQSHPAKRAAAREPARAAAT